MSCNRELIITNRILCAKACTTPLNELPIAALAFSGTTLYDNSTYFDSYVNHYIRWVVYNEDTLIYDFDFNNSEDFVLELSNGSTYKQMNLGVSNGDILSFLESLPNTIIPIGTKFTIYIEVSDSTGLINNNISNKYCFSK